MFLDDTKAEFFRILASCGKIDACVVILGCKDWLTSSDKWQHFFIPVIEEIIFDDGKIEMIDQILDLVGGILDSDRQSALMSFVCQP